MYSDGQTVSVSVSIDPGYEFLGWAGDLSGSSLSTNLVMDSNKTVFPAVRKEGYAQLPQLTNADLQVLPEGETITLNGSNLTGATGARMLWAGMEFPAATTEISGSELQVVMPQVWQEHRDHILLVETATGSTVGAPDGVTVVHAGEWLDNANHAGAVVVETGGVLELNGDIYINQIIAEDGAIIDFASVGNADSTDFFYSPDTVIIGTIPTGMDGPIGQQITSIRPSYGLDTFTIGYTLDLQVEGPGSVVVSPDQPYYQTGEAISMTATPATNAYFIRWIGPLSGHELSGNTSISENRTQVARFSTAPNYFTVWRLEHFTTEELQDINVSAFDADPDRDGLSNAAEYAFGTDPRTRNEKRRNVKVKVKREDGELRHYASYMRPKTALDINYITLISSDLLTWNFSAHMEL